MLRAQNTEGQMCRGSGGVKSKYMCVEVSRGRPRGVERKTTRLRAGQKRREGVIETGMKAHRLVMASV